ncbi:MAG: hypothetical protein D6748_11060 [Calditrichaeota bacterium]|nr:MAG: hypothetical protein D6748_11060 [Calditrichota bacterium]
MKKVGIKTLSMILMFIVEVSTSPLLACPNCFGSSSKGVAKAFITSYYLLSGIPLFMLGIGGYLLYRINKKFGILNPPPVDKNQKNYSD